MPQIPNPNELSTEVKDKYQVFDNSFVHVAKSDPKDELTIEVGDTKQSDEFYPQVKISRWSNEVNASFRFVDDEPKEVVTKVGVIKFVGEKKEVHFYDIPVNETHKEGGYEIEVLLKEIPVSNVLSFSIKTKGLDFFYQPKLTDEEVLDKQDWRPENIVGSYAVYHKTKQNNYPDKHYRVGKAFHIYRPKITDANGDEVWGILNIDEEVKSLTITVDQNWLNNAMYPVLVDPTFGYTSAGASEQATQNNIRGSKFTGSVGTGDNMNFHCEVNGASADAKGLIYDVTADDWLANDDTVLFTNTTESFTEELFDTDPTFAVTVYILCIWGSSIGKGQTITISFDTGDTGQGVGNVETRQFEADDDPPAGPYTFSVSDDRKYSIFVNFTTGGAAARNFQTLLGVR